MPEDKTQQQKNSAVKQALKEESTVDSIKAKIDGANSILVAISKNPSVDEMAAAIGFTLALGSIGKRVTAIYSGKTPNALAFLHPKETFEVNTNSLQDFIIALDKEKADHLRYRIEGDYVKVYITPYRTTISEKDLEFSHGEFNVDLVIALNVSQIADFDAALAEHGRIMHDALTVNISNAEAGHFGDVIWTEKNASSVCEMVLQVLDNMGIEYTKDIATALMTGLVANTERFTNEKTTPAVMGYAAKLMGAGADQKLIANEIATKTGFIDEPEEMISEALAKEAKSDEKPEEKKEEVKTEEKAEGEKKAEEKPEAKPEEKKTVKIKGAGAPAPEAVDFSALADSMKKQEDESNQNAEKELEAMISGAAKTPETSVLDDLKEESEKADKKALVPDAPVEPEVKAVELPGIDDIYPQVEAAEEGPQFPTTVDYDAPVEIGTPAPEVESKTPTGSINAVERKEILPNEEKPVDYGSMMDMELGPEAQNPAKMMPVGSGQMDPTQMPAAAAHPENMANNANILSPMPEVHAMPQMAQPAMPQMAQPMPQPMAQPMPQPMPQMMMPGAQPMVQGMGPDMTPEMQMAQMQAQLMQQQGQTPNQMMQPQPMPQMAMPMPPMNNGPMPMMNAVPSVNNVPEAANMPQMNFNNVNPNPDSSAVMGVPQVASVNPMNQMPQMPAAPAAAPITTMDPALASSPVVIQPTVGGMEEGMSAGAESIVPPAAPEMPEVPAMPEVATSAPEAPAAPEAPQPMGPQPATPADPGAFKIPGM